GAGAGGIATAARLAKAGFRVTVVEKNDFTGGRCSLIRHGGYRFDQGPSLLLLPKLFRETFFDLGTTLEDEGVELIKCPTNYHVWFADSHRSSSSSSSSGNRDGGDLPGGAAPPFELSTDLARMKIQVERWEGKDGFARYLAWLREAHAHYELSVREVLHRNFDSWAQLAADLPALLPAAWRLHPLESIWSRAGQYFRSERLRRVFTFATMYMGMSPFDAPATYSLLQYAELAEGVWYPARGGFHAVLDALVRVGERLGVEYRLGAPVRRILTMADGRTTRGVLLESGEEIAADIVVVNADLVYAYGNLFPQQEDNENAAAVYARSLRRRDTSCSSISFYWSLNRKVPELGAHNIFLADEYRESFDAIFDRQSLPEEPSFYINVPSRLDESASPEGCDSVIALVPVGRLLRSKGFENEVVKGGNGMGGGGGGEEQDWPALVARARRAVLDTVSQRTGCAPLEPSIAHELVNDPRAWESKFNLDKGAILGLSHSLPNVLTFRPRTRARDYRGVYFVGASTHPGTGVPIVLAGAKITAEQILADCGVRVMPWDRFPRQLDDQGVPQTAQTGRLDRIERRTVRWDLCVVLLILCIGIMWYWR
ncbi:hypothetical protein BX600DRAFT_382940, partial [Xylariales sp. PMI_506]